MLPVGYIIILSAPVDVSNMHYNLFGKQYSCLRNSKNISILLNVGNTGVTCLENRMNAYLSKSRVWPPIDSQRFDQNSCLIQHFDR